MKEKSFLIKSGKALKGTVEISGYKNSAGAVIAASLLSEKSSTIDNLPRCLDILNMVEMLKDIGVKVEWLNNKAKVISRKAYGFKYAENYILNLYHYLVDLP